MTVSGQTNRSVDLGAVAGRHALWRAHRLSSPEHMDLDGTAEFSNVVVRGQLDGAFGTLGTIHAGTLNNLESTPTAGIRLDAGSSLPASWDRYIDLAATTTQPFIEHPALTVLANGKAEFRGSLVIDPESDFVTSEALVIKYNGDQIGNLQVTATSFMFAVNNGFVQLIEGAGISDPGTVALGENVDIAGDVDVGGTLSVPTVSAGNAELTGALEHTGGTAGFFGASPVSQPVISTAISPDNVVEDIKAALIALGLITDVA